MRDRTRQLLPAAFMLAFGLTLAGCRGCGCGGEQAPVNAPNVAGPAAGPAEQPAPQTQPGTPEFGAPAANPVPVAEAVDGGPPGGATSTADQWKKLPPGSIVNISSPAPLESALSRIPGARLAPLPQDQWRKDVPKELMDRKKAEDLKEIEKAKARAHRKEQKTP